MKDASRNVGKFQIYAAQLQIWTDNDTISDQFSHQALIQVVSSMCNRSFTSLVGQLMERN
jgi:hypothetical protein